MKLLSKQSLLPSKHLVDTGYVDGPLLAASRIDYGVELLGPTRADYHWQAREQNGFAASDFPSTGPVSKRFAHKTGGV